MSRQNGTASREQKRQSRSAPNSEHPSALEHSEFPGRVRRDRTAREGGGPEPCEVGYGKPPTRTQFKKGRSGNPSGRPKHSRNFKTMIEEILNTSISVRDGEKQRKMTRMEAMLQQTWIKAAKGDIAAMQALLKYALQAGLLKSADPVSESPELTAAEQAIFDEVKPWIRSRFAKCK
jgi:hypothetical protein